MFCQDAVAACCSLCLSATASLPCMPSQTQLLARSVDSSIGGLPFQKATGKLGSYGQGFPSAQVCMCVYHVRVYGRVLTRASPPGHRQTMPQEKP
jgi:hypothetical protein